MIKLLTCYGGGYVRKLRAAACAVSDALNQKEKLSVSFRFVSAENMRGLNRDFRRTDKPTDVLSFPNLDLEKPVSVVIPPVKAKDWPLDTEPDSGVFLGDIVICRSIARKQSAEYGHSEEREIVYLFIHGLLHLFGFDHIEEADKKIMRGVEKKITETLLTEG